ncbi:hypothetical protein [Burkholderia sp. A9]|uniref:hypothetical protein n=1 Tax=Burkholderia sp. A9 TaxID=1365108 RepID=UPI001379282A|nr:hypothetical protein [Burkholderia sp. A9]
MLSAQLSLPVVAHGVTAPVTVRLPRPCSFAHASATFSVAPALFRFVIVQLMLSRFRTSERRDFVLDKVSP